MQACLSATRVRLYELTWDEETSGALELAPGLLLAGAAAAEDCAEVVSGEEVSMAARKKSV